MSESGGTSGWSPLAPKWPRFGCQGLPSGGIPWHGTAGAPALAFGPLEDAIDAAVAALGQAYPADNAAAVELGPAPQMLSSERGGQHFPTIFLQPYRQDVSEGLGSTEQYRSHLPRLPAWQRTDPSWLSRPQTPRSLLATTCGSGCSSSALRRESTDFAVAEEGRDG